MKKRLFALGLVSIMALSLVACGDEKVEEDTATAETTETTAEAEVLDCSYDWKDYVTLGDYKGIEVKLDGEYEFTEEGYQAYMADQIAQYVGYVKDESLTEIKEDSIVNVDYVGSQDGVAFDGGSAEDQTLDIAANGDINGTSYIEGFTAGLVGHSVGEEVAYEVTFPENYGNTDLAGQTVIFTFQVNYIATAPTVDTLTDEQVVEYFASTGATTVAEFKTEMKKLYEEELANNLDVDKNNRVIEQVVANAQVSGVPDNFVETRMNKYLAILAEQLGEYTIADYVGMYGYTEEEYIQLMRSSLESSMEQQMVFEAIADVEGIEIDETKFTDYVNELMEYNQVTDEDTFYDTYTVGNLNGKDYFNQIYLADMAMQFCVENAVVVD